MSTKEKHELGIYFVPALGWPGAAAWFPGKVASLLAKISSSAVRQQEGSIDGEIL